MYGFLIAPANGGHMSLQSDFDTAWTTFLTGDWLQSQGNGPAIQGLAAITAASIKGLAAQLDFLREELISKGINISA
jgi:hypothetical protein